MHHYKNLSLLIKEKHYYLGMKKLLGIINKNKKILS
jgi:hypothetical protein